MADDKKSDDRKSKPKDDTRRSSNVKDQAGGSADSKSASKGSSGKSSNSVTVQKPATHVASMVDMPNGIAGGSGAAAPTSSMQLASSMASGKPSSKIVPSAEVQKVMLMMEHQGKQVTQLMEVVSKLSEKVVQPSVSAAPPIDGQDITADNDYIESDDEEFLNFEGDDSDGEESDKEEDKDQEDKPLGSLLDKFGNTNKLIVPEDMQIFLWNNIKKIGAEYPDDAWRTVTCTAIAKRWTGSPSAAVFSAPKADSGLLDLHYKDLVDLDKQLTALQTAAGAAGAIVTSTLVKIEDQATDLVKTAEEYADPEISIANPREEISSILVALKEKLMNRWAKDLSDLARVAGAQHSMLLLMRRALFLKKIGNNKGAKNSVKRLQPSAQFLFGGKVGDVTKDLKASEELNPLSGKYSKNGGVGSKNSTFYPRGRGRGRGRGGGRGYQGNRGGGGNHSGSSRGGSSSGSRLDRFKDS